MNKENVTALLHYFEGAIIVMCIVLVYLFIRYMRRCAKYEKELNAWRNSLRVGDEVITPGGERGTIESIEGVFRRTPVDPNEKVITVSYKTTRGRLWKPDLKTPDL